MSNESKHYQTFEEFEKEIEYEPSAYEDIVVEIACERVKKGLTQEQLADVIGSTQSVISRFENLGRKPSLEFIERLAKALGHTLNVSIFGEYCASLSDEFMSAVDTVSETLGETKQEVVNRVYKSSLRHLKGCIKWSKVETRPPVIPFPVEQNPKVRLKGHMSKDHAELRGCAG